jgi:hypothetical protein
MAITECPNCHHDLQTPKRWWYSEKAWEDFECPYCRAQMKLKKYRSQEIAMALMSAASVVGVPRHYLRTAEIVAPVIPILYILFNLARPKLILITAPYNEERDLKQRLALRQSSPQPTAPDAFAKQKEDAITDFRINPRRSS